jgi:hypothetical protein
MLHLEMVANRLLTMNALVTQIRPDVERKCKSVGLKGRKGSTIAASTIASYLRDRPEIVGRLKSRKIA